MRKLTVGLLIFISGWSLSWITNNYFNKDPLPVKQPVITNSSKSVNSMQSATGITSTVPANEENIDSLLQRNEFEAAVGRYESFQDQLDDMGAADARTKILTHARLLVTQSRLSLAELLLQRFLVAAMRDVEARILLAEVYVGEQNFDVAIDQMYEARAYAYRPLILQQITSRIQAMVAKRASSLKSNNDQYALLALYQHLTQLEPDHAPWFIGLATTQLALEDKEAARRSLLLITNDPDVGAQAQNMLEEITIAQTRVPETQPQVSTTESIGIPLHRKGNHFIVDASLPHNRDIRLLIDTGASLTMLTPDIFVQPGIQYKNTGQTKIFNTANGAVRAPVYILDSLTVGDWQISQLEVGVLAMSGDVNIDGLLGMNFLQHFQFFIDQNEALLRLSAN